MTIVDAVRQTSSNDPLDHDDFALLVKEHRTALFRHALRSTHNDAAADDVVQETFLRAYRAYPRLQPGSHLGPWLHQILANVCIDEANRRRRENAKLERFSGEASVTARDFSTEQQLGLDADHQSLETALASLPIEYRQALTMRFVDDLSYHDLATSVGVTEQNARARVSRARHAVIVAMRGAAVFPLTTYFWLRRGRRASAAFDRTQGAALAPATPGASAALSANRLATSLAPAIDAANNLVTAAPAAAPLLGRVAVGVTMVAAATIAIGHDTTPLAYKAPNAAQESSERQRPAAFPGGPSDTTIVVVAQPLPAAEPSPRTPATSLSVPTFADTSGVIAPLPATPVQDGTAGPVVEPTALAAIAEPAPTAAVAVTTSAPIPLIKLVPALPPAHPAPGTTVAPLETSTTVSLTATTTGPDVASTAPPSSDGAVAAETVPSSSSVPVTLVGGHLNVGSVSVSPAGPRLDLFGSITFAVGNDAKSGTMQGRVGIDTALEASSSQRFDGSLQIALGDGTSIDLRLAGFAVINGDGTIALSGQFRASGDTGGLVTSGSFSGMLGASLTLNLTS